MIDEKPEYQSSYANSYALLIGIDEYEDPAFSPLGEAEADAERFAEILSAPPYQFRVYMLLGREATKTKILNALYKLQNTQRDDRLIIYFAGHGYTRTDLFGHEEGYLACFETVAANHYTALEMEEVTDIRRHAKAKHIAIILDACFSGRALGLTRSIAQGAADKLLQRRAYQVMSAGAGDQAVSDAHSMTRHLLTALEHRIAGPSGLVTLNSVGFYVREQMSMESKSLQIPQYGHIQGSQGGEFVFFLPKSAAERDTTEIIGFHSDWEDPRVAEARYRDLTVYCPYCRSENIYDPERAEAEPHRPALCWSCRREVPIPPRIHIDKMIVMLNYDTKIYPHHIDDSRQFDFSRPIAEVTAHPDQDGVWGLTNTSDTYWIRTDPNEEQRIIAPGRSTIIAPGVRINFGRKVGIIH